MHWRFIKRSCRKGKKKKMLSPQQLIGCLLHHQFSDSKN
ncbi:hypothetical protein OIU76_007167 [Salix suchowensis]|nr:hypothetical protein OIU76_007167 [Salix suchowensis]